MKAIITTLLFCNFLQFPVRGQSKFCVDFYFSQKPTFKNTENSDLASIKSKIFPGFALSYTWPIKRYEKLQLSQRFIIGSLIDMLVLRSEKSFIYDGWESKQLAPLLSPFLGWGLLFNHKMIDNQHTKINLFFTPRVSFYLPFTHEIDHFLITDSGQKHVYDILGTSGALVLPIPSIEGGFEWILKKERKRISSISFSYSFSGLTIGKGRYILQGTNESLKGNYKFKANSFIIGINKRY